MNYYLRANLCLQKWYQYLRAIHQDQGEYRVYLCIYVSMYLSIWVKGIYFQTIERQFQIFHFSIPT